MERRSCRGADPCAYPVVDDEPDLRRGLQRLVTRLGHTVKSAGSAEEADQWLTSERFDLLMLGIELPRMSGVEFLSRALTRDPETRLGPVYTP